MFKLFWSLDWGFNSAVMDSSNKIENINEEFKRILNIGNQVENYNEILHLLKCSLLLEQDVDVLGNISSTENIKRHVSDLEANVNKLISLLNSRPLNSQQSVPKEVLLYILLLRGENAEENEWTSPTVISCVRHLQIIILETSFFSDLSDLLLSLRVESVLSELKHKLLSTTWKNHPAAVACFIWIISHVKVCSLNN